MNQKTTILFDMYGVILEESKGNFIPYTFKHFPKEEHERLIRQFKKEQLFTKAGNGEISSDTFLTLLGYDDPEYHMKNYIENYLTIDSGFISFAEKYYRQYNFVLLSTDVSEWSQYITKFYGLDQYFKHKIVSGDVRCRKPDRKIYHIALEQIQAEANECLFIDDNVNNIVAAQNVGITSILFNRYDEQYSGEQVHSFNELDQVLLRF